MGIGMHGTYLQQRRMPLWKKVCTCACEVSHPVVRRTLHLCVFVYMCMCVFLCVGGGVSGRGRRAVVVSAVAVWVVLL